MKDKLDYTCGYSTENNVSSFKASNEVINISLYWQEARKQWWFTDWKDTTSFKNGGYKCYLPSLTRVFLM